MGIDYTGLMIIGVDYDELPEQIKEDNEDIWQWADDQGFYVASLWFDAGTDGMIIGIQVSDCEYEDLDNWFDTVKQGFADFESIVGIKPRLIGTQDIY